MLLPEKQGVGVSIGSQSGFPCNGDIQIMQGWKVSFPHVCFSRPRGGDSELLVQVRQGWLLTAPEAWDHAV